MKRIEKLSNTYKSAAKNNKTAVYCSDEKTGIQATSHIKETPMKPGKVKRVDPEYKRNGTTCLIASKNVATGKIASYQQGQTRTEIDYLNHCTQIVNSNKDAKEHIIVCDQLNTHKSKALVMWVAEQINDKQDLGIKGKQGILKSQESRMKYLEDETHSIRFLYTPKHCSWMNQIENWFGILQKKVIKHANFDAVEILENKIDDFINYYNKQLAKPMKWKFDTTKYRKKLTN